MPTNQFLNPQLNYDLQNASSGNDTVDFPIEDLSDLPESSGIEEDVLFFDFDDDFGESDDSLEIDETSSDALLLAVFAPKSFVPLSGTQVEPVIDEDVTVQLDLPDFI